MVLRSTLPQFHDRPCARAPRNSVKRARSAVYAFTVCGDICRSFARYSSHSRISGGTTGTASSRGGMGTFTTRGILRAAIRPPAPPVRWQ